LPFRDDDSRDEIAGERVPVSVVIPTFNRPAACRAAVESVLAQRPLPLEVLVCDDASPAAVVDDLREWCESRPDLAFVGLTQNRGPAEVRNKGIERARGDWIAFLDDDDRWLPGKLAAQWSAARSGGWDVIAANGLRQDGTPFYEKSPPRVPTYADLHAANPIILSTVLARRARLLEAGGFPKGRRHAEDYELWLAMADHGARFLILEGAFVRYEDTQEARLSAAHIRLQLAMARLATRRFLRAPRNLPRARAAARETVKLARFLVGRAMGR
jgi:glycosyltransferase involved in cell wall biosynthesis